MKLTKGSQRRVLMVLFLWLLLLMSGYLVLHNLYAFTALPTPPILYLLPAFIYILAACLGGSWGLFYLRVASIGQLFVLALSIALLIPGILFGIQGIQLLQR